MDSDKHQNVKKIFLSAIELPADERDAFLNEVCADDHLRREVDVLIKSFENQLLKDPGKAGEAPLVAGYKLKHYEICEKIGAGGMGEVYLARDTRLNRLVAIKFLLPNSGFDARAEKRLLREAQSVAALDHPNICTVHEIGEFAGHSFIVMQYVEGETLDARIKRASLSVRESVAIAADIADALSEAHSHGIIHRDIKPSNVIISSRGQIKVLDFSLAKKIAFTSDDTTQTFLSQAGIITGTIAYMSPEQARGQEIDERSDIWSLGVVLYEMITGRLPFKGETKSDVIAAILLGEYIPAKTIVPDLPPAIDRIINKALQKDRSERYSDIKDLSSDLKAAGTQPLSEAKSEIVTDKSTVSEKAAETGQNDFAVKNTAPNETLLNSRRFRTTAETHRDLGFENGGREIFKRAVLPALLLFAAVAAGFAGWTIFQPFFNTNNLRTFTESSRGKLQLINLYSAKRKPDGAITNVSFSPDGKLIAFLMSGEGISDIYVRQAADQGESIKVTDGKWMNQTPVWSPDGQRIAFVSNRDGKFGIWTVSYLGGTPVLQTPLEARPIAFQLKKWSNDGKRIYTELGGKIVTIELDSGQTTEIPLQGVESIGSFGISYDEKMIAYIVLGEKREKIWVQSLETGETKKISENDFDNWYPAFFPDNQRIAYSSNQNGTFQIYVADLSGSEPTQLTFGDSNANVPAISPDGKNIAYVSETDEANIFSLDLKSGREIQHTSNTKMQLFPDVSPDGEKMVFQLTEDDIKVYASPLRIKNLKDENEPDRIAQTGGWAKWSPNGEDIAFLRFSGENINLWKIDVAGQREMILSDDVIVVERPSMTPFSIMTTPFDWSPDGNKIVYSVRDIDVYNLWTVDKNGENKQMVTNSREKDLKFSSPVWSPDGRKIAFIFRRRIEKNKSSFGISVVGDGLTANLFQSDSKVRVLGWSKSGSEIYAAVENPGSVELIAISAEKSDKPKNLTVLKGAYLYGISLSPDTGKIAFSARRNGVDNIFLYSIGESESQATSNLETTLFYSGLAWSPDGNRLFYSKQTGGVQISVIADTSK